MRRPSRASVAGLILVAALLAGCVQEPAGGPPAEEQPTLDSEAKLGLRIVAVTLHASLHPGDAKTWRVEARNNGPPGENVFQYREGCGNPWGSEVLDASGRSVAWQEPMVQCQGFQNKELAGGGAHPFSWTWDARVWDEGEERYEDAPAGRYTVAFTFEGTHEGTHPTAVRATTSFEVR